MSKQLAEARMRIWVEDGQFLIGQADTGSFPAIGFDLPEDFGPSNGLFRQSSSTGGLMVMTGISLGWVAVTLVLYDERPDDFNVEWVEDIVEHSLTMALPDLVPVADEYRPEGGATRLTLGTGTFRVLFSATDRDYCRDGIDEGQHEHYILEVWPAPPEEEVVVKMHSQRGIESAEFDK